MLGKLYTSQCMIDGQLANLTIVPHEGRMVLEATTLQVGRTVTVQLGLEPLSLMANLLPASARTDSEWTLGVFAPSNFEAYPQEEG